MRKVSYDNPTFRVIAHELAHGIAGLEHPFASSANSGRTDNLMDYNDGEKLYHFQWDLIQDPKRVWLKWSKDEGEGESSKGTCVALTDDLKQIRDFILPDSTFIHLPTGLYAAGFNFEGSFHGNGRSTVGALCAISDGNYDYWIDSENSKYFGYYDKDSMYYSLYSIKEMSHDVKKAASVSYSDSKFHILLDDKDFEVERRNCRWPDDNILKTFVSDSTNCKPCQELLEKYKDLVAIYEQSHVLKVAIEENPCILNHFQKFEVRKDTSEFMKGLYAMVEGGLTVALIPVAVPTAIELAQVLGRDFLCGFVFQLGTDCIGNELVWRYKLYDEHDTSITSSSKLYDWKELLADAVSAGLENVYMKKFTLGKAAYEGLISVDCLNTFNDLFTKDNKKEIVEKQLYKFCVGAICSLAAEKLPVKLSNAINKIKLPVSELYSRLLKSNFNALDACRLSIFVYYKYWPNNLPFDGHPELMDFLCRTDLDLDKITQKRIDDIGALLKRLSTFEGAEQKLIGIVNGANNPYRILQILEGHPHNTGYTNALINSLSSLLEKSKTNNKALREWQILTGPVDKYEIFHCTKDGKLCTLYLIEETCIEFLEYGKNIVISELGNEAKSDKVYENIAKDENN